MRACPTLITKSSQAMHRMDWKQALASCIGAGTDITPDVANVSHLILHNNRELL